MPAVIFGLNKSTGKSATTTTATAPSKRKAAFDAEEDEEDEPGSEDKSSAFASLVGKGSSKKPSLSLKSKTAPVRTTKITSFGDDDDDDEVKDGDNDETGPPPAKSPKLAHSNSHAHTGSKFAPSSSSSSSKPHEKYSNLSALRNARLQESKVAEVDSSVYDYDAAYESFASAAKNPRKAGKDSEDAASGGPKYMNNLLASSEQRKRDQLRAREKALQREREQEGDEFAGKDKFVTSAYKKQQEELRLLEEEEKRRLQDEESRRAKGEGMLDFRKNLLRRDEERQKAIEEAAKQHQNTSEDNPGPGRGPGAGTGTGTDNDEMDANKLARELNEKGARIVLNDDGEVVDKRQLLSAGLNIIPKHSASNASASATASASAQQGSSRSAHGDSSRPSHARNAREAQRERQTRMMERQLEEMTNKAEEAARAEEKELQEKTKSKITDEAKMDAKARYLARKREREEAAKRDGK